MSRLGPGGDGGPRAAPVPLPSTTPADGPAGLPIAPGAAAAPGSSRPSTATGGPRPRRPRVITPLPRLPLWRVRMVAVLGVLGPGLVSGFADNDAGGITTYSLVGTQFGYGLLWVILVSQVALFFTQEVGARLGLATGKGLMGLIRERWGVRWVAFAVVLMLVANLGSTVAEFAGIGSALSLFGIPPQISASVAAVVVVVFIAAGSYGRVQYLFVGIGILVSVGYAISAILAGPDWGRAAASLVTPQLTSSPAYWLAVVGTVGTTITPWGQSFIQSYVADKGLREEDLAASRVDVFFGALLTNLIAAFIVVACAATLWTNGQTITTAADAARALEPLAGPAAAVLFGIGLVGASLLGLGVVPLTSAYATSEAFGWETGVDWNWREAPAFYSLLAFFIGFAAIFVMIPGLPLIQVMFTAQVINALLLPFILVFVMLLAGDRKLLGSMASGRILLPIGWLATGLLILLSVILAVTSVLGGP